MIKLETIAQAGLMIGSAAVSTFNERYVANEAQIPPVAAAVEIVAPTAHVQENDLFVLSDDPLYTPNNRRDFSIPDKVLFPNSGSVEFGKNNSMVKPVRELGLGTASFRSTKNWTL